MNLEIWKCHPTTIRIEKAEKTQKSFADENGVKFCKPYSLANSAGWWIYPPIDIDVIYLGNGKFSHEIKEPWGNEDFELIKRSLSLEKSEEVEKWCLEKEGRTKFTWGAVEPNVMQLWTGCIFKTEPGIVLNMRNPVNMPSKDFKVMEGIIESDWMFYDIWINLTFEYINKKVELRRNNWPPIAQLVPTTREMYEQEWDHQERDLYEKTEDSNNILNYWAEYNTKKFCRGGNQYLSVHDPSIKKDSTTFHKEKKRWLPKGKMIPDKTFTCPFDNQHSI